MSASPHAPWPLGTPFLCQPGKGTQMPSAGGGHNRKNREADVLAVLLVHAGRRHVAECVNWKKIFILVWFPFQSATITSGPCIRGTCNLWKLITFLCPPQNGVNVCLKVLCMWWNDTWIGGWITVWNRYLFIAQMTFLFIISFFLVHWHPWLKFWWKIDFEIFYFHINFKVLS